MKFYCLHEGFYEGVQGRLDQLRAACEKLSVEFIQLNSLFIDYSTLPILGRSDLLYNATRGNEQLESLLLNKDVTTFYINNPDFVVRNSDTVKYSIIHEKAKLSVPKTIYKLTNDKHLLAKYVEFLNGFPIVIKASGSTRGIGTIKIESWAGLYSTIDFLLTTGENFIMREFINATGVGRCRVLGNKVIQSYEFPFIENDFRTSSIPFDQLKPVKFKDYPSEIKHSCIDATRLSNLENAAVDFMIDKEGRHYILEINFPAGLPLNWESNDNTIALQMIDFLKTKSERNGK